MLAKKLDFRLAMFAYRSRRSKQSHSQSLKLSYAVVASLSPRRSLVPTIALGFGTSTNRFTPVARMISVRVVIVCHKQSMAVLTS